jgi:hypothetical protein
LLRKVVLQPASSYVFEPLPERLHSRHIEDAVVEFTYIDLEADHPTLREPVVEAAPHRASLRIGLSADDYVFELALFPTLPMGGDGRRAAAARGLHEYFWAPAVVVDLTKHMIEGGFTRRGSGRLVRSDPELGYRYGESRYSPFQPHGPWERTYGDPTDPTLAARMRLPIAGAPNAFSKILNGIGGSAYLRPLRLTIRYRTR